MSDSDRDGALTPAGDRWRPRRHVRLLMALLAALALALAAPAASVAEDGDGDRSGRGGDNLAQAVNEEDGSSVFDFAFSIRRVAGEVVDEQNLAVAYASCVECQTVAIALQIVLVEGIPDAVTPTNVAIALNEECAACTTVALAYQFVVGRGEPVRFTTRGLRELARIRREFQKLGRSDLSAEELVARAEKLRAEVADVLAQELVPVDDDGGGEDRGDDERSEGGEAGEGRRGGSAASDDDAGGAGAGAGSDREPTGRERTSDGGESGGSPGAGDSGASSNGGSSGGGESPDSTPPAGSGSASGASP